MTYDESIAKNVLIPALKRDIEHLKVENVTLREQVDKLEKEAAHMQFCYDERCQLSSEYIAQFAALRAQVRLAKEWLKAYDENHQADLMREAFRKAVAGD